MRPYERAQFGTPHDAQVPLGEEYTEYAKPRGRSRSAPSGESSIGRSALLYLPNRFLDLLDVVRADVGVGPAFGGVIRITKWGQVGYREFSPLSVRVGLRGRKLPLFIERSSELGIGPTYLASHDREITPGEIGVGIDLFLAGVSLGVSVDEVADFFAGVVGVDLVSDDLS